ncbi:sigma-70 family RNA polymerase sigma factor [Paenibacillus alvei]|uniref:RNA polymerase sigma factor n=1 Tax=Paenibacillus alvei TaxID=44250 RepID=UPI000289EE16|nr:sigma-70 family RNA polymerase sigma factor [Paenibacillus alvei]EJW16815.1 RNA polymerase, sigma-24 subunit, ECF subfamily [Paenibacillus alvei DSM 29]MCY9540835.1 sigma-70 family RNA polymerase sigma factor [Paenibacillus alvei]MCY9705144.1 sigma-70 family RNA polymerase sigma factor [Paenibacillus alvei]MCY9733809.1 sigma-70 family RNA polymerase sigma factor [Paenibacillus alvei]MCY9756167.1 sigma-70 family RNA polymerase sigma factor [Paenibacillus alvei]
MGQALMQLYAYVQNANQELQAVVYDEFRKLVYADIYCIVQDRSLTEDVIQEASMKALTNIHHVRHPAAIRSWLKQVARHTAFDVLRKNKSHNLKASESMLHTANSTPFTQTEPDISITVENKLRDSLLHQSMSELKSHYQALLRLHYFENKSYKEISKELHLSEQVISQRLARARIKLRQQFSKKWS